MEIVDGAWIFLAFILLMGLALVLGLYTRTGSGINHHPYGKRYDGAPGPTPTTAASPVATASRRSPAAGRAEACHCSSADRRVGHVVAALRLGDLPWWVTIPLVDEYRRLREDFAARD